MQRIPTVFFDPRFAKLAAPPDEKTGKGEPFEFKLLTDAEFEAFRKMKKNLLLPPILALPRHGYKNTVDSDACEYQVGCALLQSQPNGDHLRAGY